MRSLLRLAMVMTCLLGLVGQAIAEPRDPARWEQDIQAFETQDRQTFPPKDGVLFVGSSSIRLWKLDEAFPDLHAINRGFGGSEIVDSLHFVDRIILPYQPKTIVFYAGDNDIANGRTAVEVSDDFRRLAEKIHEALPKTRILYLAIKPSQSRWEMIETQRAANDAIAKFAEEQEYVEFIDTATPLLSADGLPNAEYFQDDKLHLSDAGYRVWNELLAPHLK